MGFDKEIAGVLADSNVNFTRGALTILAFDAMSLKLVLLLLCFPAVMIELKSSARRGRGMSIYVYSARLLC